MKYGIDCGHNCPPDTGCDGIHHEDALTLAIGNRVITKLKALGFDVVSCNPKNASSVTDSLSQRCQRANEGEVDVYVSIHFNCYNGNAHGSEVYAVSEAGQKIAAGVLSEVVKLGFTDRGVKDGSHLYVLKNTAMPAVLVECCFCDHEGDVDRLDLNSMATAIVKGLTGKTPK